MTALGLLKVYCVVLLIYSFLYSLFVQKKGFMSKISFICSDIFISVIIALITYGLGWLFIMVGKWIMLQFGIVAANDVVYTVIYILLNLFSGIGTRTYIL